MDTITHEMRMVNWTKLIQDCLSSGLSKKEWCLQNHVNEKLFYYWQRKIRKEAYENQAVSKHVNHEAGFVEVPALPKMQESTTTSVSAKIFL